MNDNKNKETFKANILKAMNKAGHKEKPVTDMEYLIKLSLNNNKILDYFYNHILTNIVEEKEAREQMMKDLNVISAETQRSLKAVKETELNMKEAIANIKDGDMLIFDNVIKNMTANIEVINRLNKDMEALKEQKKKDTELIKSLTEYIKESAVKDKTIIKALTDIKEELNDIRKELDASNPNNQ